MNRKDILDKIHSVLSDRGLVAEFGDDDTRILSAMDSIVLAVVLVELEDWMNFDPFVNGFINFKTVAELISLYEGQNND